MTKLRILYLINNLEIGGAEIALANLVNDLPTKDFEIWIGGIFGLGPVLKRFTLPADHFVSFDFHILRPFFDLLAFLRLFRFLRKNRIHIIHTHLPLANIIGRSIAWLAGVPIIISTEQSTYYEKSLPFVMADRLLARITTQMTAISQAVQLFASGQAHLDPEKFLIIPNCIPFREIQIYSVSDRRKKRRELGIREKQSVIITIGRLSPEKGHHVLLDAAQRVVEERSDVLFLFVGDGPCKQSLISQVKQKGLEQNTLFLGFRQDIPALLQISTIMALPSLREGLSVSLIEASACYLPIVASRIGGIPEVVEDGVSGILVPPGDNLAMAKSILHLLDMPELRSAMGQEGRIIAVRRFDSEVVAKKTAELYCQLWSERTHPTPE